MIDKNEIIKVVLNYENIVTESYIDLIVYKEDEIISDPYGFYIGFYYNGFGFSVLLVECGNATGQDISYIPFDEFINIGFDSRLVYDLKRCFPNAEIEIKKLNRDKLLFDDFLREKIPLYRDQYYHEDFKELIERNVLIDEIEKSKRRM